MVDLAIYHHTASSFSSDDRAAETGTVRGSHHLDHQHHHESVCIACNVLACALLPFVPQGVGPAQPPCQVHLHQGCGVLFLLAGNSCLHVSGVVVLSFILVG